MASYPPQQYNYQQPPMGQQYPPGMIPPGGQPMMMLPPQNMDPYGNQNHGHGHHKKKDSSSDKKKHKHHHDHHQQQNYPPVGMQVYGQPVIQQQPMPNPYQQPMHMQGPPPYGQAPMPQQKNMPQFKHMQFYSTPIRYDCYHCGENITTKVTKSTTQTQCLCCVALTFVLLCCIPYLCENCYHYKHHCPKCNGMIGASQNK
ncbi:UNKNOWN [Stylonychia lemnae]|uniref:LITAF domain-containing protein n=1 Tax=Stylonychia lemnae TaxID=5949 RepID=A0A078AWF1_STYLE|nr:UNKNOWN [Stylonychia lemnae]|eukprot:CDW85577.1 UNKNOWN [Stylonychia lemnae]